MEITNETLRYMYHSKLHHLSHLMMQKTKAQISFTVTAKLISAFVFATLIVQFLYFLNPKFSVSSILLCLYSPVCVGPVWKPHCWLSREAAQFLQMRLWNSGLSMTKAVLFGCTAMIQDLYVSKEHGDLECVQDSKLGGPGFNM